MNYYIYSIIGFSTLYIFKYELRKILSNLYNNIYYKFYNDIIINNTNIELVNCIEKYIIENNCNINKRKKIFDCCFYYLCCKCCKCCKKNEIKEKNNIEIKNLSIKKSEPASNSNNSNTLNTKNSQSTYNSTPSSINYQDIINNNKDSIIIINSNDGIISGQTNTLPIKPEKRISIAIIHDYKPRAVYNASNEKHEKI